MKRRRRDEEWEKLLAASVPSALSHVLEPARTVKKQKGPVQSIQEPPTEDPEAFVRYGPKAPKLSLNSEPTTTSVSTSVKTASKESSSPQPNPHGKKGELASAPNLVGGGTVFPNLRDIAAFIWQVKTIADGINLLLNTLAAWNRFSEEDQIVDALNAWGLNNPEGFEAAWGAEAAEVPPYAGPPASSTRNLSVHDVSGAPTAPARQLKAQKFNPSKNPEKTADIIPVLGPKRITTSGAATAANESSEYIGKNSGLGFPLFPDI